MKLDFVWWIAVQAVATALSGAVVLVLVFRRLGRPHMRLLPHRIVSGLAFSSTQVVRMTQLQVDRLLIGMVASAYVTGIYAAASRVISLGTMPMVTLLRMTYPHFFSRGANGMRAVFPFGMRVLAGLLLVALVTVVAFYVLAPFLPALLGNEYQDAVGFAQLLAPISFAFAFQYAGGDMLSGAGHQNLRFMSTVLNLLCIAAGILVFAREGEATAVVIAVLGGNTVGAVVTWTFVIWLLVVEKRPERVSLVESNT
jgi:O-antigen/teichoic acid export membrane protein